MENSTEPNQNLLATIPCKSCKKTFDPSGILKHINHRHNKSCRTSYTNKEIELIKECSKDKKKKNWAKNPKKETPTERASRYRAKKKVLANQYQRNKGIIAQKYQEKKEIIAQKYQDSKEEKAKKYQNIKEIKASEKGQAFSRFLENCIGDEWNDLRYALWDDAIDYVLEDYDQICENSIETVFKSNSWIEEVESSEYEGISEAELNKMIESSMDAQFEKLNDDHVYGTAYKMRDKEWEYVIPGFCRAHDAIIKKAEKILLNGQFDEVYEKSYDEALESVMSSDVVLSDDENGKQRQFREDLDDIILKNSVGPLKECMSTLIFDNVETCIRQDFFKFKKKMVRLDENGIKLRLVTRNLMKPHKGKLTKEQMEDILKTAREELRDTQGLVMAVDFAFFGFSKISNLMNKFYAEEDFIDLCPT